MRRTATAARAERCRAATWITWRVVSSVEPRLEGENGVQTVRFVEEGRVEKGGWFWRVRCVEGVRFVEEDSNGGEA